MRRTAMTRKGVIDIVSGALKDCNESNMFASDVRYNAELLVNSIIDVAKAEIMAEIRDGQAVHAAWNESRRVPQAPQGGMAANGADIMAQIRADFRAAEQIPPAESTPHENARDVLSDLINDAIKEGKAYLPTCGAFVNAMVGAVRDALASDTQDEPLGFRVIEPARVRVPMPFPAAALARADVKTDGGTVEPINLQPAEWQCAWCGSPKPQKAGRCAFCFATDGNRPGEHIVCPRDSSIGKMLADVPPVIVWDVVMEVIRSNACPIGVSVLIRTMPTVQEACGVRAALNRAAQPVCGYTIVRFSVRQRNTVINPAPTGLGLT